MTTIMTMTTTTITIGETTMTDKPTRAKPAVAAKVMVTGVSLTSVLAMTAAMGSASSNSVDDTVPVSPTDLLIASDLALSGVTTSAISLPPNLFEDLAPTAPVVGQVVAPTSAGSHPLPASSPVVVPDSVAAPGATPESVPAPTPAVAPTPIVVQIPTPAPAPSASTSKSR